MTHHPTTGPPAARLPSSDAALLGVVQGFTEFLPISSSAHLSLMRRILHRRQIPRAFDVALHLGTTAALLPDNGRHLLSALISLGNDALTHGSRWSSYRPASRLALRLALATAPAILVGALYHGRFNTWAERPSGMAAALITGSIPMAIAEAFAGRGRSSPAEAVPTATALLMGIAQAAALTPGISRSGATIAAGMVAGLDRESATRYSFLLAVPVTLAATAHTLPAMRPLLRDGNAPSLAIAVTASLIAGLAGIDAMKRLIQRGGLRPFVLYRLGFAAVHRRLDLPPAADDGATPMRPDRPARP